jgi:EAL domain-containing protein (putative c-di-GMP-specific phosphodiesterase class I)
MERLALESSLRRSLDRNELELYFQPQINLQDGTIVGAEALLRWHHPQLGMVPPDKFIPLAEESGMITAIGEWVLRTACEQAVAWSQHYPGFKRIAVNLSGVQVQRGDIVDTLRDILEVTGLPAETLELEITESVLMHHPEIAAQNLNGLRELGIELAIDDFGTGYSSLSYLKRFPLQILKIDRSFVMDIPHDPNDTAITRAVIAMAKSLQLRIVAEGVETEEQERFLTREGCDLGQGYYYSRPLPAADFTPLLESSHGVKKNTTQA